MRIDKKETVFKVSDVDGFKVDGTKLLDRCGNEFVMRGVKKVLKYGVAFSGKTVEIAVR